MKSFANDHFFKFTPVIRLEYICTSFGMALLINVLNSFLATVKALRP